MGYELRDLRYQKKKHTAESLIKHMKSFKLQPKFSLGIWYFSPGGGRFHDRYVKELSIEERINVAAEMKGLGFTALEAHFPNEINMKNIDLYKNLKKETGIGVVGIPFAHFFEKEFEFGAMSNPNPEVRKKAINYAIEAMTLAKEIGASSVISWPGMDGFTYDIGNGYRTRCASRIRT